MNGTRGYESVNPRPLSIFHGVPSGLNVLLVAPREAADDGDIAAVVDSVSDLFGDDLDGLEVVLGGGGEAGFDDVDAELGELASDVKLLLGGHGGARGLFAVAEGGVEDADIGRVGNVVGDVLRALPRRRRGGAGNAEFGMRGLWKMEEDAGLGLGLGLGLGRVVVGVEGREKRGAEDDGGHRRRTSNSAILMWRLLVKFR